LDVLLINEVRVVVVAVTVPEIPFSRLEWLFRWNLQNSKMSLVFADGGTGRLREEIKFKSNL
jgi:hypothetical protein